MSCDFSVGQSYQVFHSSNTCPHNNTDYLFIFDTHQGSYIFGGRPPTPSRGPSQKSYSQQLREQAGWTREQSKHTQKDQDMLDRLQQAQLAQE